MPPPPAPVLLTAAALAPAGGVCIPTPGVHTLCARAEQGDPNDNDSELGNDVDTICDGIKAMAVEELGATAPDDHSDGELVYYAIIPGRTPEGIHASFCALVAAQALEGGPAWAAYADVFLSEVVQDSVSSTMMATTTLPAAPAKRRRQDGGGNEGGDEDDFEDE